MVGAGVIDFMLYYILPKPIFMIVGLVVGVAGVALAFVSINGMPLLDLIMKSVGFSLGGKDYTWQKKESPYPFKTIKRAQIKKIEHAPVLQAQKSQIRQTKTAIELKTR